VDVVIHHHYQQYQGECMVMVEPNHDRVYLSRMHEQGMLLEIDGHEMWHC
jgi:hypothetical protein